MENHDSSQSAPSDASRDPAVNDPHGSGQETSSEDNGSEQTTVGSAVDEIFDEIRDHFEGAKERLAASSSALRSWIETTKDRFEAELEERRAAAEEELAKVATDDTSAAAPTSRDLRVAVENLDGADSQAELLSRLLEQSTVFASRAMLLLGSDLHKSQETDTKDPQLKIWNAIGFEVDLDGRTLPAPEGWSAVLAAEETLLAEGDDAGELASLLDCTAPKKAVAIPFILRDSAYAVLYCDDGAEDSEEETRAFDVDALQILNFIAAQSMECLTLRTVRPSASLQAIAGAQPDPDEAATEEPTDEHALEDDAPEDDAPEDEVQGDDVEGDDGSEDDGSEDESSEDVDPEDDASESELALSDQESDTDLHGPDLHGADLNDDFSEEDTDDLDVGTSDVARPQGFTSDAAEDLGIDETPTPAFGQPAPGGQAATGLETVSFTSNLVESEASPAVGDPLSAAVPTDEETEEEADDEGADDAVAESTSSESFVFADNLETPVRYESSLTSPDDSEDQYEDNDSQASSEDDEGLGPDLEDPPELTGAASFEAPSLSDADATPPTITPQSPQSSSWSLTPEQGDDTPSQGFRPSAELLAAADADPDATDDGEDQADEDSETAAPLDPTDPSPPTPPPSFVSVVEEAGTDVEPPPAPPRFGAGSSPSIPPIPDAAPEGIPLPGSASTSPAVSDAQPSDDALVSNAEQDDDQEEGEDETKSSPLPATETSAAALDADDEESDPTAPPRPHALNALTSSPFTRSESAPSPSPTPASAEPMVDAVPMDASESSEETTTSTDSTFTSESATSKSESTSAAPYDNDPNATESAPEKPAPGSSEVAPPVDLEGPGKAFRPPSSAAGEDPRHEEARRLARLLVSELKLYNEDEITRGRRIGNIYQSLREDIDRSKRIYDERVAEEVRQSGDFLHEELVRGLADGDPNLLGM